MAVTHPGHRRLALVGAGGAQRLGLVAHLFGQAPGHVHQQELRRKGRGGEGRRQRAGDRIGFHPAQDAGHIRRLDPFGDMLEGEDRAAHIARKARVARLEPAQKASAPLGADRVQE